MIKTLLRNDLWIIPIIEGKIERKSGKGRSYMKQIMLDLGKVSYKKLKEVAMNREEWTNISLMKETD